MRQELHQAHPDLAFQPEVLSKLADQLYDSVGRDAAADLVLGAFKARAPNRRTGWEAFTKALATELYPVKDILDLAVRSLHRQLAALAIDDADRRRSNKRTRRFLVTTNYDPLLELALCAQRAAGAAGAASGAHVRPDWVRHRFPPGGSVGPADLVQPIVEHVHGWVEPGGSASGAVVLTVADYLDLLRGGDKDKWAKAANQTMQNLFSGKDSEVLIIGMSLQDLNIRRFLRERATRQKVGSSRVYVVFQRSGDPLLDRHLELFWAQWDVELRPRPSFRPSGRNEGRGALLAGGGCLPPHALAPPLPAPYGRARLRRDSHLDTMLVLDRLAESWVKSAPALSAVALHVFDINPHRNGSAPSVVEVQGILRRKLDD